MDVRRRAGVRRRAQAHLRRRLRRSRAVLHGRRRLYGRARRLRGQRLRAPREPSLRFRRRRPHPAARQRSLARRGASLNPHEHRRRRQRERAGFDRNEHDVHGRPELRPRRRTEQERLRKRDGGLEGRAETARVGAVRSRARARIASEPDGFDGGGRRGTPRPPRGYRRASRRRERRRARPPLGHASRARGGRALHAIRVSGRREHRDDRGRARDVLHRSVDRRPHARLAERSRKTGGPRGRGLAGIAHTRGDSSRDGGSGRAGGSRRGGRRNGIAREHRPPRAPRGTLRRGGGGAEADRSGARGAARGHRGAEGENDPGKRDGGSHRRDLHRGGGAG